MTATVSTPLKTGEFYETHIAYRLALIHSTCSSNLLYNLSSKLATQTHQLHYPLKNVIFRHHYIGKNSSSIETEQCYLCRVLHFNRQNLMLITPPNDQAPAYGTY